MKKFYMILSFLFMVFFTSACGEMGKKSERLQVANIILTPPVPEGVDETRYFSEFEGTSIPIGLVIPDNTTAYVANTRSDAVSIINLETMKISGHYAAGLEPDGINHSPLRPAL